MQKKKHKILLCRVHRITQKAIQHLRVNLQIDSNSINTSLYNVPYKRESYMFYIFINITVSYELDNKWFISHNLWPKVLQKRYYHSQSSVLTLKSNFNLKLSCESLRLRALQFIYTLPFDCTASVFEFVCIWTNTLPLLLLV